ncbi:MAG: hypothetical protein NC117_07545 [Pseudoflavonifractor sp.]|nr:hypothetical protein [Pseudoflavonifractor sp.]
MTCLYYLILTLVLILTELCYIRIARRYGIGAHVSPRSSHKRYNLSGGGIIFIIAAVIVWVCPEFSLSHHLLPPQFSLMMVCALLLAAVSFADDLHNLSPRIRLVIQIVAVALTFHDYLIYDRSDIFLLILICGIGFVNAYNFMDGINGMMAGYSIVTLVTLRVCFDDMTEFRPFINTLIIAAAVFAFFNFRKNAKCFAGDVGSIVMGFFILYLMVSLIGQTGDASVIVFLIVYAIDTVFTIFQRLFTGENILLPHRHHLYQVLANQRQIPHHVVSLSLCAVQGGINLIYFYIPDSQRWTYFILVTGILTALYFIVKIPAERHNT